MRKVSAVNWQFPPPEKMIGEKFQSKMRKVSAEENELQEKEQQISPG